MRAGMVLEALATHYDVWLHVVPVYKGLDDVLVPNHADLCVEIGHGFDQPFQARHFDVVHAFRLSTVPTARRARATERHVDLDEIETATHRRLAALCRANGDEAGARIADEEAVRYAPLEEEVAASWDRVYTSSAADRDTLTRLGSTHVRVLPNAVRLPADDESSRSTDPFGFLFCGTLGYYPNEDAIVYFCDEVVPLMRELTSEPFRVIVVGAGPPELSRLERDPAVQLTGWVPDVSPWYRRAGAAVVPIRAGGGTRIKILEAFAHRCPVVSTPLGCEGLDVRDGEHLLVGATPEALARRCVEIMADPALALRLTEAGHGLVLRSHTVDAVARAVAPPAAPPRSGDRGASAQPPPR